MFRKGEHDTPEPAIDAVCFHHKLYGDPSDIIFQNADELWRPYPLDVLGPEFTPVPANVMSCFREQCKLCKSGSLGSPHSTKDFIQQH